MGDGERVKLGQDSRKDAWRRLEGCPFPGPAPTAAGGRSFTRKGEASRRWRFEGGRVGWNAGSRRGPTPSRSRLRHDSFPPILPKMAPKVTLELFSAWGCGFFFIFSVLSSFFFFLLSSFFFFLPSWLALVMIGFLMYFISPFLI